MGTHAEKLFELFCDEAAIIYEEDSRGGFTDYALPDDDDHQIIFRFDRYGGFTGLIVEHPAANS